MTHTDLELILDEIAVAARKAVAGEKVAWMVVVTAPTSETDNSLVVVAGGTVGRKNLPPIIEALQRHCAH